MSIKYNTGFNPSEKGVYACRIPSDILADFCEDKFLLWYDGWCYLGSDQNYRGEVVGWLGPLERLHT